MVYKIVLKKKVLKGLRKLPKHIKTRFEILYTVLERGGLPLRTIGRITVSLAKTNIIAI